MISKEILPEEDREFIRKAYCNIGKSEGTTVYKIFKALETAESRVEDLELDLAESKGAAFEKHQLWVDSDNHVKELNKKLNNMVELLRTTATALSVVEGLKNGDMKEVAAAIDKHLKESMMPKFN